VQPVQCGAATMANMAPLAIESLYVSESKGLPRVRIPLSPPNSPFIINSLERLVGSSCAGNVPQRAGGDYRRDTQSAAGRHGVATVSDSS
jgi:hypothetical protein